ncbi:hypothetical protein OQH61_05775 [Helicobacter sp. MIT 21-1697]|uniref:hypothetical protein n=1 Tax=Helicobacter sp. MIT 21-1697 TaxID=2993733 RepID=UPI00224A4CEF|nr:hypothetical protein [Helicobacter sp. MIT 21-1697]MCX2717243.1 hypothetical protein [Helicobacter sp. MIT 21-1697]
MIKHIQIKIYIIFLCLGAMQIFSAEIDVNPDKRGWHIELKRIAANLSSTSIRGQEEYAEFSDSRIKGDSQLIAQGFFDLGLDFYAPRYVVFNSVLAEYGRTILVVDNKQRISNTTLDRILLSTDYTHRIWYVPTFVGGFEVGPFFKLNYQSGFENRHQIIRFNMGMKLFDGVYIKDLHLNAFSEKNFTLKVESENYGWESGIRLEYKFNEDTKFYYFTNFRHYLYSSAPESYNPLYQLEIEARVDTKLYKKLAIAPFIKYYALQGRHISQTGNNLFVGFSLSFGYTFLDATKKQELMPL